MVVSIKGGRWHIIPQLAVYTTYILPSGRLYATYHFLWEPETAIDFGMAHLQGRAASSRDGHLHGVYG